MFSSRLRGSRSFLAILLFALALSPSYAVHMEAVFGYDGFAKSGCWTPVTVKLANTSGKTVDGELSLVSKTNGFYDYTSTCLAKVNLPPNSNKLYRIYARTREYNDMTVVLSNGSKSLASQKLNPNIAQPQNMLVVSVGDRTQRLNFLAGEQLSPSSNSTIAVGSIPVAELYDRPSAYEGINMLVLSDLPVSSVDPKVLKAISMWVASGGTLVVSTGPDYKKFDNAFFNELLPVTLTGSAGVKNPAMFAGIGPVEIAVAKSTPKPGICSYTEQASGIPLVAERRYGLGRVVFLAFDRMSPPFNGWNSQDKFWLELLKSPGVSPMVTTLGTLSDLDYYQNRYGSSSSVYGNTLMEVVRNNPRIKTPEIGSIALFLLAYLLILVPVNGFILHRRNRRELAWITTPAIVVLFTIGAYLISYTMKGSHLQLDEVTFVEGSNNARFARVITDANIFSPASRSYSASTNDPFPLTQVIRSRGKGDSSNVYLGEQTAIDGIKMAMWSSKTLESVGGVDLGGSIKSDLVLSGDRLHGKITNNTSIAFKRCYLVMGQSTMPIKDFKPGASVSVDIEANPILSPRPNMSMGDDAEVDMKFANFVMQSSKQARVPVLYVAPMDAGKTFEITGYKPKNKSLTAYTFKLDYKFAGSFSLQPEQIPGTIMLSQQDYDMSPHNPALANGGVQVGLEVSQAVIISYSLPHIGNYDISALQVQWLAPGSSGIPKVWAYNWGTCNWEHIDAGKPIPNAGRFVGLNKEVRLKLQGSTGRFDGAVGLSVEGQAK